MPRLLAIGDIHGCFDALASLSESVPFRADDTFVLLGDLVDRGPDSKEVVDWAIEQCLEDRCIVVRGNHEIMMLEALAGRMPMQHWLQVGGRATLESYRIGEGRRSQFEVPDAHRWFLERELKPYYETEDYIFVHATLEADVPLTEQSESALYWERFDWIEPHHSGKTVICGHTAQKAGVPWNKGHAICIDTWVYGDGWLTCLEPETGRFWQANQRGETRTGRLGPADAGATSGEFHPWRAESES